MLYSDILEKIRQGFPAPYYDPDRDAYLVETFRRALELATELKGESPILGEREDLTPHYTAAQAKQLADDPSTKPPA